MVTSDSQTSAPSYTHSTFQHFALTFSRSCRREVPTPLLAYRPLQLEAQHRVVFHSSWKRKAHNILRVSFSCNKWNNNAKLTTHVRCCARQLGICVPSVPGQGGSRKCMDLQSCSTALKCHFETIKQAWQLSVHCVEIQNNDNLQPTTCKHTHV